MVPQYARFDATAAYRQPNYDLRLNVFNLFNMTYYDADHRLRRRARRAGYRA